MSLVEWHQTDTVFLDMDGTLLDLHFDNYFWLHHVPQRYAEKEGMNLADCKQLLFDKMMSLRGQLKWYSIAYWSDELGLPILELKNEVSHLIGPRPYVHEFLATLREHNKNVVLFTNAHEDTLGLKMQKVKLRPYFDEVITSHQLGLAKEMPGAWEKLSERYHFDKTRSLFIDDSFSVLDEAKRYGIASLLGISLPDLKGKPMRHDSYALLSSYKDIMPV
ncbi:MAG: HAD superfamily hydrolase (TIGR01509 family) [Saprospiraceae bacterium]|jgi:HAD superfamily hydrolase (TIGR01509 family)